MPNSMSPNTSIYYLKIFNIHFHDDDDDDDIYYQIWYNYDIIQTIK